MVKSISCGFIDARADSFRKLDSEKDDFPYFSKRIRDALRCDIKYLYQKNVRSFNVSENNDSDIAFLSLVSETNNNLKKHDINTLVYCSLDKDALTKELIPFTNTFISLNADAPQNSMLSYIDYLIYIDGNNKKKVLPASFRNCLKKGAVIHFFDGLYLEFRIDYYGQQNNTPELPSIIKSNDLSLMKQFLTTEIEYCKDRIQSATINAILTPESNLKPGKFIELQERQIETLTKEINAVQYMLSNKNNHLKRLYWRWKRKLNQGRDSSALKAIFYEAFSKEQT